MKILSWLFAIAGALVFALAIYGRFHGALDIRVLGHQFSASTFLLVANTLLLFSVVSALHGREH